MEITAMRFPRRDTGTRKVRVRGASGQSPARPGEQPRRYPLYIFASTKALQVSIARELTGNGRITLPSESGEGQ